MRTEHRALEKQVNILHQQSEKGSRPLGGLQQSLSKEMKMLGAGGMKFIIKRTSIRRHLATRKKRRKRGR